MDGVGLRVAGYDLQQIIDELRRGAVWCRFGKVPPRLRLDAAEDVGRAAPLVLAIAPRNPSRPHGPQWTDIGVQDHRLLIHAYDVCLAKMPSGCNSGRLPWSKGSIATEF